MNPKITPFGRTDGLPERAVSWTVRSQNLFRMHMGSTCYVHTVSLLLCLLFFLALFAEYHLQRTTTARNFCQVYCHCHYYPLTCVGSIRFDSFLYVYILLRAWKVWYVYVYMYIYIYYIYPELGIARCRFRFRKGAWPL